MSKTTRSAAETKRFLRFRLKGCVINLYSIMADAVAVGADIKFDPKIAFLDRAITEVINSIPEKEKSKTEIPA